MLFAQVCIPELVNDRSDAVFLHDETVRVSSEVGLIGDDGPDMSHHGALSLVIPCQSAAVKPVHENAQHTTTPEVHSRKLAGDRLQAAEAMAHRRALAFATRCRSDCVSNDP